MVRKAKAMMMLDDSKIIKTKTKETSDNSSMQKKAQHPKLNKNIINVHPSPTLMAASRARELTKLGKDIVSFTVGEPDFDTPDHIKNAAIDALNRGFTKYTAVEGITELKEAVSGKLKNDQGLDFKHSEIIITNGGKHALAALFAVILNEGDEVVIPSPYWTSYPDIVTLSGGKSKIVETESDAGYLMTPGQLTAAVGKKTKAIILNSPSNPTGAVYSKADLRALADAFLALPNKDEILIISDEVYDYFTYGGVKFHSILQVAPELRPHVAIVNSLSKTYAMTGWRVGFAAGPRWLIDVMSIHQSQFTANVCSIAQAAAQVAFKDGGEFPRQMLAEFTKRRDLVVAAVKDMPGIELPVEPHGAFFAFLRIDGLIGSHDGEFAVRSAQDFATYLIERFEVATVAGEAFGDSNAIRISYALSMKQLEKGLARIKDAALKLQ